MSAVRYRPVEPGDLDFLAAMLGEAAVWRPDKPTPSGDEVMADPRYAGYLAGWPRPGDLGVVAEDGEPVGAAWCRLFPASVPGHGFVADDVPELAIAVVASRRGEGIGCRLLTRLVDLSVAAGHPAMSLNVREANPARRLYESLGFVPVKKDGTSWTMLRKAPAADRDRRRGRRSNEPDR